MTCLILATGPSLSRSDVALVKWHRSALRRLGAPPLTVYAVNRAIEYAPWADVLYSGDPLFWRWFAAQGLETSAERVSICASAAHYGATIYPHDHLPGFGADEIHSGYNSGYQALNLAILHGHTVIALLGYDMQHTGGKRHCHDDYPEGMGNADPVDLWRRWMEDAARMPCAASVVNCTRETALTGFERVALEDFLEALPLG